MTSYMDGPLPCHCERLNDALLHVAAGPLQPLADAGIDHVRAVKPIQGNRDRS